jgi:hypothetical protein
MNLHRVLAVVAMLMVGIMTSNAQDRAVDAIVKKNQMEVEKAEAAVKRANETAIKALTNLAAARTKSKDTEGVARCQQAIAQITGKEVDEVADNAAAPGGATFPEGTFKWKGIHYYVFPKTKWANYEEAEAACKELGGHILRISSKKEYQYFLAYRTNELKRAFWILLEKLDITVKDESFKQTEFVVGDVFGSNDINVPFITQNFGGKVEYRNVPGSGYAFLNQEIFIVCEWEKQ